MRVELGKLVPALEGWVVCESECDSKCTVCDWLPGWAHRLKREEQALLALYLAARATMDYRVLAAAYIYMLRHRAAVRPELLVRARREARVESRVPPRIEDETPYAWQAVFYRGLLYAQTIMSARESARHEQHY